MKPSPPKLSLLRPQRKKASVLLITLGFVLLITVITVAFLVRSRSSLQTSQSYSKEFVAGEIGDIAIDKLAAEFQTEIKTASSHSPPLDILLPPRIGVSESNPRNSALVRRTTGDTAAYNNAYLTAGFPAVPHSNRASTVSTETVAKNGWSFDKQRWLTPGLLRANETFTPPDWVYVYGNSKANTSSATDKESDIVGRFAAMVYDVGGLLDINETGVPSTIPLGDKGSAAFADLSAVFPSAADADKLTQWRNGATATAKDFYGDPSATNPADAGSISSPVSKLGSGKNRFFSRMEFVEAARAGKLGLSEALLPSFRTRSESANHVAMGSYFANGTSTLVRLSDPSLAAAKDTTFTVDRIDGSKETYTIKQGWPLIQNRFPLARLRWLADCNPDGSPKHSAEIKKYFGLTWDSGNNIFIYTSPDSDNAATDIKTLTQLVAGINGGSISPREPDFFELLKAAVNPDSLGQTGGSTDRVFQATGSIPGTGTKVAWEYSKDLHILRIGANIIDQSDPDSIPTGIRSQFSNVDPSPFDSFGQENLPYLNEVITTVLRDDTKLNGYLQFEMWNPNRNASSGTTNTVNHTDFPKNFQGGKISNFRVRILKGRVVMDPMVNIISIGGSDFQIIHPSLVGDTTNLSGAENHTSPWRSLKRVVEYSQRNLGKDNFIAPNLTDKTIYFMLDGNGAFFDEPFVLNGSFPSNNDMDTGNPTSMSMDIPGGSTVTNSVVLGGAPSDGSNAILICTVKNIPNPNFSGLKAVDLWTSASYDAWVANGRPCNKNTGNIISGQGPSWAEWWEIPQGTRPNIHYDGTPRPSGAKAWNAVTFYSSGGETLYDIQTEPVTIALEVQDGSNTWHTYQIYNNLSLGTRGAGDNTIQSIVISGDTDTKTASNWAADSNTTDRCFASSKEWEIRKGYPNTDPRTERFGMTDEIYASPGMSIRTHTGTFQGEGNSWNLPNGLNTSVGTSWSGGSSVSNEKSAPHWALYGTGAANLSIPADLAINVGAIPSNGAPQLYHSYSDDDDVVRPADARWAPMSSHPALPVGTYPDAKMARPVMLNRPFRNVAELGCVFRDIPWKSLDLFTPDSADRRLVDVFSVEDRPALTGKINPNLASKETLKALLYRTSFDPSVSNSTDTVLPADADPVANAIFAAGQSISSGEKLAELLSGTTSGAAPTFNLTYKTKTENFLRALSSTTDTRSWQLILDVVAQSGRIAQGSTNLTNFIVDGQHRFFVYLTLDRITGEVIDKHIEPVYE